MKMKNSNNKIYVCGDTHGFVTDTKKLNHLNFPEQDDLTKEDVVIQLGDFGWVWYPIGSNKLQEYWLDWLAKKNFTLAVVLGNHENYDIIEKLPIIKKWGDEVRVLKRDVSEIYFFKKGAVYTINGKKVLTIGGALSIDKSSRSEGVSWWAQEELSKKELENSLIEIVKHDKKFDYVLTHTCPKRYLRYFLNHSLKMNCSVSNFLDYVKDIVTFESWHFGHFHQNRVIEEGRYICHYNNPPFELGTKYTPYKRKESESVDMTYFDLPVYKFDSYGYCVLERDIDTLPLFSQFKKMSIGKTMGYLPKYGALVYLHDWEEFAKMNIKAL
jgi:hypothetical protein